LADLLEQVRRQNVKETWRLEWQIIGWLGFGDADMKDLAQLKGLANVWIRKAAHEQQNNFKVTAAGWSQLRQLPKLRWLGIGDMNDAVALDDDSFAEIAKLTELDTLYLNCNGSAQGVKKLLGLKKLAGFGLNVHGAGADDTLVKEIVAAMPDLESLTISYSTISDQGMKELAKLKRLSHLAIGSKHVTDAGLQEVARMKKMAVVNIASSKITEDGTDRLWEARPDLFMLNGVGVHHGPDSYWTMQVDFFHSAQAMPFALSEKEFAKAAENPALKRLGIGWPGMSARDMKNLSRCRRLSHLSVTQNIQFGPNNQRLEVKLDADAWKPLSELPRLQMLVVHDVVLDAESFAAIGKCKELRTLRLVNSKGSDAGALQLFGLEKLTGLELSGAEITGAGLEKFGRFKNLHYLSLNGSKITDDGLKHLSDLPHLMHIDLTSTR
jgi:internalin A